MEGSSMSSILTLLGSGHQKNLYETYQRRMYSRKLLMMGRQDARNIDFCNRISVKNSATRSMGTVVQSTDCTLILFEFVEMKNVQVGIKF